MLDRSLLGLSKGRLVPSEEQVLKALSLRLAIGWTYLVEARSGDPKGATVRFV